VASFNGGEWLVEVEADVLCSGVGLGGLRSNNSLSFERATCVLLGALFAAFRLPTTRPSSLIVVMGQNVRLEIELIWLFSDKMARFSNGVVKKYLAFKKGTLLNEILF
jgi:hypothetical protein